VPDAGPIRILLVDDQALFRSGLRMLLDSQDDLEVVGEAANGEEAVAFAEALDPDVVLMDIRMPRVDGVTATERLAERGVRPKVLVLTTFDLDEAAARAIRAGASGFVLKDADPEFLLAAVRTVHAGTSVIAAAQTRELFEHFVASERSPVPAAVGELTSREREIFLLAARGLSNAEIAAREFVSEATVKTHVNNILRKTGVRDRAQAVRYAFRHGLAVD
jgi:DNA-binding NarL/FixJ family response regulator